MKKAVIAMVFAFLSAALVCTAASAANIGDVVGVTLHTDIVAYIDEAPIESYNFNGYTAIVAEDLLKYGFEVIWNEKSRALYISDSESSEGYTPPNIAVLPTPSDKIGTKKKNVYYTDIRAYFNDTLIQSYNIGGYTIIMFEDLIYDGEIKWDNSTRRIDFRRGKGGNENSEGEDSESNIKELIIIPDSTVYMRPGESVDITAVAVFKDGSSADYTESLEAYISKGTDTVAINGTTVKALETGNAVIRFDNSEAKNSSVNIVVNTTGQAPKLVMIGLEVDSLQSINIGETFTIKATGYYDDETTGNYTELEPYIYSGTNVVSISGAKVKGLIAGSAKIRFNNSLLEDIEITVVVSPSAATIKSATLTDTSIELATGKSYTITAKLTYSDGSTKTYTDIEPYIYSGDAYVKLSGKRITGLKAGTARIKFEDDYLSGKTLTVKVTDGADVLKSAALDVTTREIGIGSSYGYTITATATYGDDSTKAYTDIEPYIYSGEDYVKLSGKKVIGLKVGTAKIKFNDEFLSGKTLTVKVLDNDDVIKSVALDETSVTVGVGKSYTVTATSTYGDGTEKNYTAFTPYIYSGESYVKISGKKITGVKAGTARIKFTDDYLSAKTLTVKVSDSDDTISSVTLSATSYSLAVGSSYTVTATAKYGDGTTKSYTALEPYIYSGTGVVTVSGRKITAVKAGTAKIKFESDYLTSKTLTITVTESGAASTDVVAVDITSGTDKTLSVGKYFNITATATLGSGKTKSYTDLDPYIYSGEDVVSISGTKVTALAEGTAKIKFGSEFLTGVTVTVNVPSSSDTIASVTLETSTTQKIYIDEAFEIEATAKYADGTTDDFFDLEPYNYTDNGIISIRNNTITGVKGGTCTIKFLNENLAAKSIKVTVVDPTQNIKSVALDSTSHKLAVGDKITVTATATYTDRTTGLYTEAEPYISSGSSYVSISDGVVTAKKAGSAVIGFRDEWLSGKTVKITVVSDASGDISSVTLDTQLTQSMTPGNSFTIFATAKYKDASTSGYTDLEPYIYSGDGVVVIEDNKVIAVRAGTAKIRFKSSYLTATKNTITITVKGDEGYITDIIPRETEVSMKVGEVYTIKADATYYDEAIEEYDGDLGAKLTSSTMSSYAEISGRAITAKKVGSITVTFTNKLVTQKIVIIITEADAE